MRLGLLRPISKEAIRPKVFAAGKTEMASITTTHAAEVRIRRYDGRSECDVVVLVRGKQILLKCPDYSQAVKWARLECKSYQIEAGFSVERVGEHGIHSPDGDERVSYLRVIK